MGVPSGNIVQIAGRKEGEGRSGQWPHDSEDSWQEGNVLKVHGGS